MVSNKLKNVLYVGDYNRNYARNYIFINGLKAQKVNVYEVNLAELNKRQRIKKLLSNFGKLRKKKIDIIIFYSLRTSPIDFIFTKIFAYFKRIPLIYDIFVSKLLTYFYDRKLSIIHRKIKLKTYYWLYYYFLDFMESHLSNYIILDTASHIKYFREKYKVPIKKFRKIFIGTREDLYFPRMRGRRDNKDFIVGYWGGYIPLHGVEFMLRAFKHLEKYDDIYFSMIGKGQTYEKNLKLAQELNIKNIEFIPKLFLKKDLEKLPEIISNFDIGLGLFGRSIKTLLAIPNKVFEGLAMKIPMITSKSPAINELLSDKENIILCERANPKSLAKAIIRLKEDEDLISRIKEEGFKLFKNYLTSKEIGKKLINVLDGIIRKGS